MNKPSKTTRLDSVAADLVAALREASEERQRAACLVACNFAIESSGVRSPVVQDAMRMLRSSRPLLPRYKVELDELVAQLDDEYLRLQERVEEGQSATDEYMKFFGQARAVAALSFAASDDAFQAAVEAIYEAAATTDEKDELFSEIWKTLDSK